MKISTSQFKVRTNHMTLLIFETHTKSQPFLSTPTTTPPVPPPILYFLSSTAGWRQRGSRYSLEPLSSTTTAAVGLNNDNGEKGRELTRDTPSAFSLFYYVTFFFYTNLLLLGLQTIQQYRRQSLVKASQVLVRECGGQPWGFPGQPAPLPVETHTLVQGCGFPGGFPRV